MGLRRAGLLAALLASGCTMAPKYERPQGAVPAAFPTGQAYPQPTSETLPAIDRAAISPTRACSR